MIRFNNTPIRLVKKSTTPISKVYKKDTLIYSAEYQYNPLYQTNVINRATALSYPLPPVIVLQAQDTLMTGLINAGIWGKWDCFYNFAMNPGTIVGISSFTKIDWDRSASAAVFSGGLTLTPQGFKGNGSNGWIDTNFKAFAGGNFQQNNASKGFVIADNMNYAVGNVATATIAGVSEDASESMVNSDSIIQRVNSGTTSLPVNVNQGGSGFKAVSRVNDQISVYNKNVKSQQTVASSSVGMQYEHAIFRRGGSYGSMTIACAFYGASLTDIEMETFRTLYNKYLLAIGLTQFA